jgi:uncharacterized protein GlcG (DUF336 family)
MTGKISSRRRIQGILLMAIMPVAAATMLFITSNSSALLAYSDLAPSVNGGEIIYEPAERKLTIKGDNFQDGASVTLNSPLGLIEYGKIKFKGPQRIFVSGVEEADLADGLEVVVTNPDGLASLRVRAVVTLADETRLTESDVRTIIAQGVAQAEAIGLKASIAVVDNEGNALGIFKMSGAPSTTTIGESTLRQEDVVEEIDTVLRNDCVESGGKFPDCGLENLSVPTCFASLSKAVTGSFLSSAGHAFSTRTASFIIQEHFAPGVKFQGSGPLFGVQFSQFLCSDVNARSPLGLAADPGGIPIYKNGRKVGGIGVEGDGKYALDPNPKDKDVPPEELIAVAAVRGFEPSPSVTGDKIIVNGIRFAYVNAQMPAATSVPAFGSLRGSIDTCLCLPPPDQTTCLGPAQVRGTQPTRFRVVDLDGDGPVPPGRVDNRFFPFKKGSLLSASDVKTAITQAAFQAFLTRAAIRVPKNSLTEVNITAVDTDGTILGIFSTIDAPIFGFDVSAQKARTAAFFTNRRAGALLRQNGFGDYVAAAAQDGLALDGSVAFSDRAGGALSRPFFPDGIDETEHGPFSKSVEEFSLFNDGLQLDLLARPGAYVDRVVRALSGGPDAADQLRKVFMSPCTVAGLVSIANGIQIFPGSVPLFKGNTFAGGLGISGDGVDQDDIIATMGSRGFESPPEIRSDRVFVRGIRLPFTKFPRHPNR